MTILTTLALVATWVATILTWVWLIRSRRNMRSLMTSLALYREVATRSLRYAKEESAAQRQFLEMVKELRSVHGENVPVLGVLSCWIETVGQVELRPRDTDTVSLSAQRDEE